MKLSSLLLSLIVLLVQFGLDQYCMAQRTKPLQHFWEITPDFGDIWNEKETERVIRFDVEWLNSTEAQERVHVAQMICREHANPNFKQKARALELLLARLEKKEDPIQSQRAMISAATLVDDGAHAAQFWKAAQRDLLMRSTVEKALIKWKSPVAIETWRKRLSDHLATPTEIALALNGIAAVGGIDDSARLQDVLKSNNTTVANRFLAAGTLGQLNRAGLNDLAQQVLDSDVEQRHLLAAKLLEQHTGDRTLLQIRTIFNEGLNVAQLIAVRAMWANYPEVAREFVPQMVVHADSAMRFFALGILEALSDETSLRLQSKLVSDRNVDIRRLAGEQLVKKAADGHRTLVDEFITEHLNAESWQGIEQAIIMTVNLQDRTRCKKLVELIDNERPEVNMHAGWALMELAQDAAILASIEPHVEKVTAFLVENGVSPPLSVTDTIRISFLFEAFGKNKYEPMQKLLTKYIPKDGFKLGYPSRASAIWALGQINNGNDNRVLRDALSERIADLSPMQPEDQLIRFASILALGEMAFADSRPTLVKFNEGIPTPIGYACTWALEQLDKASPK